MKIDTNFEFDTHSIRRKVLKQATITTDEENGVIVGRLGVNNYYEFFPKHLYEKSKQAKEAKKKLSNQNCIIRFFKRLIKGNEYFDYDIIQEKRELLISKMCENYYKDFNLSEKTNPKHEKDYEEEFKEKNRKN